MILWDIIALVSLFQNFYAKTTYHGTEGGHWRYSLIHESRSHQCLEPGFNTKFTMTVVTGYWTRSTYMLGGCAKH